MEQRARHRPDAMITRNNYSQDEQDPEPSACLLRVLLDPIDECS